MEYANPSLSAPPVMTAAIILAAGASSRLSQPKQALIFEGKTLLEHAARAALDAACHPVIVVTGAWRHLNVPEAVHHPVSLAHNEHWQTGMAGSIRTGMQAVLAEAPDTGAVILMVCDQPFADAALLRALLTQQAVTGKSIIASYYQGTAGVPALFTRMHFSELMDLNGQEGARRLFAVHADSLGTVPFTLGGVDIDTWEDYESLNGPAGS